LKDTFYDDELLPQLFHEYYRIHWDRGILKKNQSTSFFDNEVSWTENNIIQNDKGRSRTKDELDI